MVEQGVLQVGPRGPGLVDRGLRAGPPAAAYDEPGHRRDGEQQQDADTDREGDHRDPHRAGADAAALRVAGEAGDVLAGSWAGRPGCRAAARGRATARRGGARATGAGVLLSPWRRVAGALGRCRLEGHPADALEVELRPGVQVVGGHQLLAGRGGRAGGEPDSHPRRDVEQPRHDGHRRREVHAVALPGLEEPGECVRAAGVTDRLGDLGRVVELVGAQPVLDRQCLVVAVGAVADDATRLLLHQCRQAARRLEVAPQRGRIGRIGGRLQLLRRRGDVEGPDLVGEVQGGRVLPEDVEGVGVVEPGPVDVGDPPGGVGQRQPLLLQAADLDAPGARRGLDLAAEPRRVAQPVLDVVVVARHLQLAGSPDVAGELVVGDHAQVRPLALVGQEDLRVVAPQVLAQVEDRVGHLHLGSAVTARAEAAGAEAPPGRIDLGQQRRHHERQTERRRADPPADLGERGGLDVGAVVGALGGVAHRPAPPADPFPRLGQQQGKETGAADGEGDPADAVGCDRGRHGLQHQQGEAGEGRAPQRHGERVDGQRDQPDPGDREQLDARGDADRRGVALDVEPAGAHQVAQPVEGPAARDQAEVGLAVPVAHQQVDEQRDQPAERHRAARQRRPPGGLAAGGDEGDREQRREEPGAGEERAAEADGRRAGRDGREDRQTQGAGGELPHQRAPVSRSVSR